MIAYPWTPDPVQQGIEEDGQARQVSRVLQETEDRIEGDNIGKDHDELDVQPGRERPEALLEVDLPVEKRSNQERMEGGSRSQQVGDLHEPGAHGPLEERVEEVVDESFTDLADSHVAEGEDGNADEGSPELVHAEVLDAVPPRVVPVDHPLHPADDQPDPLPSFFPGRGGKGGDPGLAKAGHEFPDSLPRHCHGGNDGYPQFFLQGCAVNHGPRGAWLRQPC